MTVERCDPIAWGCLWTTTIQSFPSCEQYSAGPLWCPASGSYVSIELQTGYLYRVHTHHTVGDGSNLYYFDTSQEVQR